MDINLLPRPQKPNGTRLPAGWRGRLPVLAVVIAAVAACVAFLVVLQQQVGQIASQVANLNTQVQTAERGRSPANHANGVANLQSEIAQAAADRADWAAILQQMDAALSAGMTVDEVQLNGHAMAIMGRSVGVAEVAAFEQNLQRDAFTTSVAFQVAKQPSEVAGQTPHAVFVRGGSTDYAYAYTVTLTLATGGTAQ
ncbi:PilN domain-containing protein [Alicyclobacillus sacchari]|uniref:PilN domain-containing protein n=1 Tax=Alicyclobacillus sacchari TaxID=392010 RepID=UPI0010650851|nr:PilN domain-containing protein [Alicyclobacillus sacchari]